MGKTLPGENTILFPVFFYNIETYVIFVFLSVVVLNVVFVFRIFTKFLIKIEKSNNSTHTF